MSHRRALQIFYIRNLLLLLIEYRSTEYVFSVHPHMLIYSSNIFLFMLQVHTRAFSPHRPCEHNTRQVYLDDHGYDTEGGFMEERPTGGCSYIYLVGDFSFGRLPEDEQLLVVPFVMRTLRMAGLGECPLDPLHWRTRRSQRFACVTLGIVRELAVTPVRPPRADIFLYISAPGSWSKIPSERRSPWVSWVRRTSWA